MTTPRKPARKAARRAKTPVRKSKTPTHEKRAGASGGVTHQTVRELFLALPGVEEGTSWGTPAFRVKKKLLARFHQDGESLVLPIDMDDREILMRADPETFYITDHYRAYPYVLVRLAVVDPDALRDLVEEVWRRNAPPGLIERHDAKR